MRPGGPAPRHRDAAARVLAGHPVPVRGWPLPTDHPVWTVVQREVLASVAATPLEGLEPADQVAAMLVDLEHWGHSRQRRRARDSDTPRDPERDRRAADQWARVIAEPGLPTLRALEVEHTEPIGRVIGIVARWRAGDAGDAWRHRLRSRLWRGFLPALADHWREVALRVAMIAQVPDLPRLVARTTTAQHQRMAGCIAGRRGWGGTVLALQPRLRHVPARAGRCARALHEDPHVVARWTDAHLIRRLVATWHTRRGDPEAGLAVMDDNESRVLARLRAALSTDIEPDALAAILGGLDGLHERTATALFGFTHGWAHSAAEAGMAEPQAARATAPCDTTADPALPEDHEAALLDWLLDVVLQGRLDQVEAWLWDRAPGGGAFWKALASAPEHLRADRYRGLRCRLAADLDRLFDRLRPRLEAVAALQELHPEALLKAADLAACATPPNKARRAARSALAAPPPGLPHVG